VKALDGTIAVGTYYPIVTLARDSNVAQNMTATLTVAIKRPIMTSLILNSVAKSQVEYTIGKSALKVKFPEYSCLPKGCEPSLDYVVELISKKTDTRFTNNA
jgi:hypothetical protein